MTTVIHYSPLFSYISKNIQCPFSIVKMCLVQEQTYIVIDNKHTLRCISFYNVCLTDRNIFDKCNLSWHGMHVH